MEAHITAPMLQAPDGDSEFKPVSTPYVALVASGGHTALYDVAAVGEYTVLGHTVDDAAGEAFDKVAKLLGLPYPGGVSIQNTGKGGDPDRWAFPRAMMRKDTLNFSFSGLKTAVRNHVEESTDCLLEENLADLCASVQEAIVDALVSKSLLALKKQKRTTMVLSGGVAANLRLREKNDRSMPSPGIECVRTPMPYCTDNAAMVAGLALQLLQRRGVWDSRVFDGRLREHPNRKSSFTSHWRKAVSKNFRPEPIRAKKSLRQHFLQDQTVLRAISKQCAENAPPEFILEIGPGTGI